MDKVNWQPLLIKKYLQQSIYFNNSVDESKLFSYVYNLGPSGVMNVNLHCDTVDVFG